MSEEKEGKKKPVKEKITGNITLDKIILKLNADFGKDDLISTGPVAKELEATSTGSLGLDAAIGIGGFPRGGIVEVYGLESSGKTSIGLAGAAQYQKLNPEKYVVIVDAEYTMTQKLLNGFGLNPDRLLYVRPDNATEALQTTLNLVKSGEVGYLLFDSIDALQSEAMLKKDIGAADVGGISKILSRFFREYHKVAADNDCTSVFINQLKYNPGAGMFANPETTPGGTALRYYAWLRLRCSQVKPSKTTAGAFLAKVKIIKNKCAPPVGGAIEFDFIYAKGPDPVIDTLNTAKMLGILAFAGSTLKIREPDGSISVLCSGGAAGFQELVAREPDVLLRLRNMCIGARDLMVSSDEDAEQSDEE